MVLRKVYLLPLLLFVLIPVTFLITYLISICLHHVEIEFPYISDTGTYIPESCIFGELLTIVALFLLATTYVKFKQVEQYYRDHLSAESSKVLKFNLASLWMGWIGAFGVTLVANFQETSVSIVHFIGTFIAFGSGIVYMWLQTVMSYYAYPLLNSLAVARVRLGLVLTSSVCFIITIVTGVIAMKHFNGKDPTKWYPKDGGFVYHLISTTTEWILVMGFDFFFLTFVRELRHISLLSPQVHFLIEELDLPTSDIYRSDEQEITHSQNNFNSSVAGMQNVNSVEQNYLTIQAVIH
ncbi:DNA damage-regulated autophagy modulator protein 1-like [Centruroides vittatus]|uniref:DNA damage-regulated autophagy modulator protein 1-like n=1 Tax=Centruroides vittatus TaxID=120091 RepID=UPI0035106B27